MTAAEILRAVLALAEEKKIIQGALAKDADGQLVMPTDPLATTFCTTGALFHVAQVGAFDPDFKITDFDAIDGYYDCPEDYWDYSEDGPLVAVNDADATALEYADVWSETEHYFNPSMSSKDKTERSLARAIRALGDAIRRSGFVPRYPTTSDLDWIIAWNDADPGDTDRNGEPQPGTPRNLADRVKVYRDALLDVKA